MASGSLSYLLLTYNQSETVRAAVRSALDQDVEAMEIVISDDCSADDTFDQIKAETDGYAGPHHVILNRNDKNLGLAGNLAKAHALSTGELIIGAAGDDLSFPHRSQRILETFSKDAPSLICSYATVVGPDGAPVAGNFRTALFYNDWTLDRAARSKSLYLGATGAWTRELYEAYGAMDPDAYEDLVLGFRAALEGRVAVIEEELVQYRLGLGLTSSDQYLPDLAAFRNRRRKGFVAQKGVMRQRIKDAEASGIPRHAPVMRILRKEMTKAALGLAFYESTPLSYWLKAARHPLIGMQIWWSERRRMRKFERNRRGRSNTSQS